MDDTDKIMDFFSDKVKDGIFSDHISRSIPAFNMMESQLIALVRSFTQSRGKILDIGCTDFRLLKRLPITMKRCGTDIIEQEKPDWMEYHRLNLEWSNHVDTLDGLMNRENFDVVTSIFTLQFLSMKARYEVVKLVADNLARVGGQFIVAEKVYFNNPEVQRTMDCWLDHYKAGNGFTPAEVMEKKRWINENMRIMEKGEIIFFLADHFPIVEEVFNVCGFHMYVCQA